VNKSTAFAGFILCATTVAGETLTKVSDSQSLRIESIEREQLPDEIKHNIPEWCESFQTCGNLVRVDCNASLDGIERYFARDTGALLMNCGGRCLNPQADDPLDCKACPPTEWERCSAPVP